jgi:hypothetical protein
MENLQTKREKIKNAAIMLGISATLPVLMLSGAIGLANITERLDKPKREKQSQLMASITDSPVLIDTNHYQAIFHKDGTNYVFNYAGIRTDKKD